MHLLAEEHFSNWLFDFYQVPKEVDKLGFRYNYDHIATVNQQLLKGGVRLAALLNQIFAS